MTNQRRRLVWYLTALAVIIVSYTLIYQYGMATFEGRPVDTLHALAIVIETFTTTGYGSDSPWSSNPMRAFVILMQFTGVTVIFLTLPLFVAPWVEGRLASSPPTAADLEDHVVLCDFSPRGEHLIEELQTWERPCVIVEGDRDRAETLLERDLRVIHGDPESTDVLAGASTRAAAALVADADDERNASIVLSARELSDDVRVVAFAEDPDMADYLRYAGADEVFSPRQLLGETLARQVTLGVRADLGEAVEIGDDVSLVELPVQPDSESPGGRWRTAASASGPA